MIALEFGTRMGDAMAFARTWAREHGLTTAIIIGQPETLTDEQATAVRRGRTMPPTVLWVIDETTYGWQGHPRQRGVLVAEFERCTGAQILRSWEPKPAAAGG